MDVALTDGNEKLHCVVKKAAKIFCLYCCRLSEILCASGMTEKQLHFGDPRYFKKT